MNGEQTFQLPKKRTILNLLVLCIFMMGVSTGSFIIGSTLSNAGFRILAYITGMIFLLPLFIFLFLTFQISRSFYGINREGLTIHWGFQKMVIPIQEIEWIRPYDQMGYTIPTPGLARLGVFSGKIFTSELGNVLFFATRQQDAYLIGTSQEVLFLSPSDIQTFQKGIQEAVYQGSITPLERKSINLESPIRTIRSNFSLYFPLIIGVLFDLFLFIVYGFITTQKTTFQVGLVLFEPSSSIIILPILSSFFTILSILVSLRLYKEKSLRLYAYLLSYSSFLLPMLLGVAIIMG
ncbi:MAG: hypothetical protein GYA18_11140 [Chloroflexi bacterium]|nr:hypothetical protein [Chloroflexota bacterium]